jgi:riboflavin biosynthesis pyrimidine reductase
MATVQSLWPIPPEGAVTGAVTDTDLERIYGYPENLDRPWVQANFISSADGAATLDGKSEGLSHPADKRIFLIGRDLADVVLVGAGTARVERYRGVKTGKDRAERRARLGLAPVPPIAVVTASAAIDSSSPLLTDTLVPPIIITVSSAPPDRRDKLAEAGADILISGEYTVDLPRALTELSRRGLRRVDCEGGPRLFGDLIADDLVDQLCLTIAPLLAGAAPGRVAAGRPSLLPRKMDLASILYEDGYSMMLFKRAFATRCPGRDRLPRPASPPAGESE